MANREVQVDEIPMICVLDIGGANLKAATSDGRTAVEPFPLWKQPQRLAHALRSLLAPLATECRTIAVTMTGELADCYADKAAGVRAILAAAVEACPSGRPLVYLVDGRIVDVETALAQPYLAAASNWHALASWCGQFVPEGGGLLIDAGSTTCDIIPLVDGQCAAQGNSDPTRLRHGELLYTGVERSPVCAVIQEAPYRERVCPLAQEWFATMRDVYLVLRKLPEHAADHDTADGRPATIPMAVARLGRMFCADASEFDEADAILLAKHAHRRQVERLVASIRKVIFTLPELPRLVILSGHGDFLVKPALEALHLPLETMSLVEKLGPELSRCAPAYALAKLVEQRAAP